MRKKRLQQLLGLLRERRNVESAEAAEFLGVSLPTIRRDFEWLAANGMACRFHGGLSLVEGRDSSVLPISMRRSLDIRLKERIAALAVKELPKSGSIFIDGGTTTACLAPFLTNPSLHIVTNSVALLQRFREMAEPHARLTMTGGTYHKPTDNFLGMETVRTISHYHADLAILSCTAIDESFLYDDPEEAAAVQLAMFENSDRSLVMADSGKFGRHALYKSISTAKVQTLVTDDLPDNETILAAIRQKGVRVLLEESGREEEKL